MNATRLIMLALLAGAAAGATAQAARAADNADWPMLAHDPQRHNGTGVEVRPPYKVSWVWFGDVTTPLGGPYPKQFADSLACQVQPVVAAGKVYVGTMTGRVFCIDANTGRNLWQAKVGGPIMNSAAVAEGKVFVSSADRCVYAFDAAAGKPLWKFETGAPLMDSPLPVEGRVFVLGHDGFARVLSAADGMELWKFDAGAPLSGSAAYGDGALYFATTGAMAYAVNAADGKELWHYQMRGSTPWYWPVVVGDIVIFRTRSVMTGPEWTDGAEEVLKKLDDCAGWPPRNWPKEREAILASLKEQPDRQNFFTLDRATGQLKWMPPIFRTVGHLDCSYPPTISPDGRAFDIFRVRSQRQPGAAFGTNYCPDYSEIDLKTGDRIPLDLPQTTQVKGGGGFPIQVDNPHLPTYGGGYLYMYHAAICCFVMDLKTGVTSGLVGGSYPDQSNLPPGIVQIFTYKRVDEDWRADPPPPQSPYKLINRISGIVPAEGALFINMTRSGGFLVRVDSAKGDTK